MMPCPLCESGQAQPCRESHRDAGQTYELHECSRCHAQFWTPLKNPGAEWYEHDERYAGRNADPILTPNVKHKTVLAALSGNPGRVLDVGCGVGNFLALAQSRGWECWGIDFDRDAIEAGKQTFGLTRLSVSDIATFAAEHPDLRFDLITFFDVFEHLDDHNQFLATVQKLLAPGGRVGLSVPYRHGARWLKPHDVPPRHLTRWDEPSLRMILGRYGLVPMLVRKIPAGLYYIILKLRFRYGQWASFGLVRRAQAQGARGGSGGRTSLTARLIHVLAKTKDLLLFGVPALVLWLALLPTDRRYTDIVVVAAFEGK